MIFYKRLAYDGSFFNALGSLQSKVTSPLLNQFYANNPNPDSISQMLLIIRTTPENLTKLNQVDLDQLSQLERIHKCIQNRRYVLASGDRSIDV